MVVVSFIVGSRGFKPVGVGVTGMLSRVWHGARNVGVGQGVSSTGTQVSSGGGHSGRQVSAGGRQVSTGGQGSSGQGVGSTGTHVSTGGQPSSDSMGMEVMVVARAAARTTTKETFILTVVLGFLKRLMQKSVVRKVFP